VPRTDNNQKVYIGIDNGVSGSIGIVTGYVNEVFKIPVRKVLNYTKTKQWLNRIDGKELKEILSAPFDVSKIFCLIERPMVNPERFKATVSALRALEATLIVLEDLGIPYQYIDSKEWQKELLPSGLKGPEELKPASVEVACRLFPHLAEQIRKHKDGDGILIAEYARRKGL
jgi:hypothetical protein